MLKQKLSTEQSQSRWTRLLTGLFIVSASSILMGCQASMPPSQGRSPLPQSLVSPCQNLTPLDSDTMGALMQKIVEVSEMYYECKRRHGSLVEAVQPEVKP